MTEGENDTIMSPENYMRVVEIINAANTIKGLIGVIPSFLNIKMASYHHFPSVGSVGFKNLGQYYPYKIPQEGIDHYDNYKLHKDDPGIIATFSKGSFIRLSDMRHEPYVIERGHDKFVKRAVELSGDGLCIPLYGPSNRKGYLFVAFENADISDNSMFPYQVQALAQMLHIRYSKLVEKMQAQVKLTSREAEVLELISFGKTNVDIGLVLKISPNTVAGYVKSIFIKLDVSDRVSAAMRSQTMKVKT